MKKRPYFLKTPEAISEPRIQDRFGRQIMPAQDPIYGEQPDVPAHRHGGSIKRTFGVVAMVSVLLVGAADIAQGHNHVGQAFNAAAKTATKLAVPMKAGVVSGVAYLNENVTQKNVIRVATKGITNTMLLFVKK